LFEVSSEGVAWLRFAEWEKGKEFHPSEVGFCRPRGGDGWEGRRRRPEHTSTALREADHGTRELDIMSSELNPPHP
jgi:hypothetical protein